MLKKQNWSAIWVLKTNFEMGLFTVNVDMISDSGGMFEMFCFAMKLAHLQINENQQLQRNRSKKITNEA